MSASGEAGVEEGRVEEASQWWREDRVVVRPIRPAAGSSLSPFATELAFGALHMVGADPRAISDQGALLAATRGTADLLELAHLPGRAVLAVDLAHGSNAALDVHLLCGIAGANGEAARDARALVEAAEVLLSRFPTCHELAVADPLPLLGGLAVPVHAARIVQRRVRVLDDRDEAEVLSRFDRETDPWLGLVEHLLRAPRGTRFRTTLLATELDGVDQAGLASATAAAERIAVRGAGSSDTLLPVGTHRHALRVLHTLADLGESYCSPTFVGELTVTSPEPLSDVLLRAVATSLTNEFDVVGRGDTPTVAARTRLVGGFEIERGDPSIVAALRFGLPSRGGLSPRRLSDLFSLTEAACAFQLPIPAGGPIPTIATEVLRPLAAPAGLSGSGVTIGHDARGQRVRLDEEQRASHLHVIGTTGTGKSTLLARLIGDDLTHGRPFVLVDPHGDLARRAKALADKVGADVLFVDPTAVATGGLELFDGALERGPSRMERIEASVSRIVDAISAAGDASWTGPRFRASARAALVLLACAGRGHHLGELPAVLGDRAFAEKLLRSAGEVPEWLAPQLRTFFSQREHADVADWAASKFSDFAYRSGLRRVLPPIGEGASIPELVRSGRPLILSLAVGNLSALDAALLGHLVVSLVVDEACARPVGRREPLSLYVDEAELLPAVALARGLAEGRKFGLSLVVAHQHLAQLPVLLRDALGNAKALFAFRLAPDDAALIGAQMGAPAAALRSLPDLSAYARLSRRGAPLAPFSIALDPPSLESPVVSEREEIGVSISPPALSSSTVRSTAGEEAP